MLNDLSDETNWGTQPIVIKSPISAKLPSYQISNLCQATKLPSYQDLTLGFSNQVPRRLTRFASPGKTRQPPSEPDTKTNWGTQPIVIKSPISAKLPSYQISNLCQATKLPSYQDLTLGFSNQVPRRLTRFASPGKTRQPPRNLVGKT